MTGNEKTIPTGRRHCRVDPSAGGQVGDHAHVSGPHWPRIICLILFPAAFWATVIVLTPS